MSTRLELSKICHWHVTSSGKWLLDMFGGRLLVVEKSRNALKCECLTFRPVNVGFC